MHAGQQHFRMLIRQNLWCFERVGNGVQVKVLIRKVRNKAAGTIGELVSSAATETLIWAQALQICSQAHADPETELFSTSAGDCTLEYDRATGRYYDVSGAQA